MSTNFKDERTCFMWHSFDATLCDNRYMDTRVTPHVLIVIDAVVISHLSVGLEWFFLIITQNTD